MLFFGTYSIIAVKHIITVLTVSNTLKMYSFIILYTKGHD